MKKAVWIVEICLLVFLSIPLGILPFRLSLKAGELYGLLLFYLWGSRRKIALQNLRNSILSNAIIISEPIKKIVRDNFKNLGKSFAEIIKIYYGLGNKIIDSVSIEGIENFDEAKSKGKGILVITGHCGNWELMSIASTSKHLRTAVVARPINNPYVNKFIENVRQKYGNYVIYKQAALKPIIKTLKDNGCVGILMDQAVISDEGYVIDFLGRGAWTTKMPALIARKTGAAVLPVFIHRTNGGHRIKINPEVELSGNVDKKTKVDKKAKNFK